MSIYPSIRSEVAMHALETAFDKDITTPTNTKVALLQLSQLIFDQSYIKYKSNCYQPKVGIPTGGCNSRQTADIVLHYIIDAIKDDLPLWKLLQLFKRFIDDIFGIWLGTIRQFHQFVDLLNRATGPFGIEFGDFSIRDSVNFLDTTLYIDENGLIQYKLYRKPTDSRLYLKTHSFHPGHVFDSIAYSQMLRIWKRNSAIETAEIDLKELETDLERCGHHQTAIQHMRKKLQDKVDGDTPNVNKPDENTITAVVDYFHEIHELKELLKDLGPDIDRLTGSKTSVLVAARKGRSVSNKVVCNKKLC